MVTPSGERPATVHVDGGRIERIGGHDERAGGEVHDVGDLALLPGFVDSHVHVNEPGRTDWEGFQTATMAACAGGVTTIVDMPLNSIPPTTSVAAFDEKLSAARGRISVDAAFWGGVVPGNLGELSALDTAGVMGFKCFMAPSGVPEFGYVTPDEMEAAMSVLAPLDSPLLVHAESPVVLDLAASRSETTAAGRGEYLAYVATRPEDAELHAVRDAIAGAERTGARVHIVHVSAAPTLDEIASARMRGVRVTAETCPHYLWFAAEEVPAGGTLWKCAPPIRSRLHRSALRCALHEGRVDLIASDHSPAPPQLKGAAQGDLLSAWGGIASLQFAPLVSWTVAASVGCGLSDLVRLTCSAPARLAGLKNRKGSIAPGMDADLVVFDADSVTKLEAGTLYHRHRHTPYDGAVLRGRVLQTWLRGELIFDHGAFVRADRGRPLLRGRE